MKEIKDTYSLAKRLINISHSILNIYDLLTDSYDDHNLYNKNLEYLKVGLETENNIYNEIGEKLLTSNDFDYALQQAFENTDFDKDTYDKIHYRIYNYIEGIIYRFPFVESKFTEKENLRINIDTITQQILFETDLLFYINLQKIMQEEKYKFLLPYLYDIKHQILFCNKIYDNLNFEESTAIKYSARETSLIFNHNNQTVNSTFKNFIINGLKTNIEQALAYEDSEKSFYDVGDLVTNITLIKTFLDITTKEEAFYILNEYYKLENVNYKIKEYLQNNETNAKIKNLIKNNFLEKCNKQINL